MSLRASGNRYKGYAAGITLVFDSPGMYVVVAPEGSPITEIKILTPDLVSINIDPPSPSLSPSPSIGEGEGEGVPRKDIFGYRHGKNRVKPDLLFNELFTYDQYISSSPDDAPSIRNPIEDVLGLPMGSLFYHLISDRPDNNALYVADLTLNVVLVAAHVYKFNLYLMNKDGTEIKKKTNNLDSSKYPIIILKQISSKQFDCCIPKLVKMSKKKDSEVATYENLSHVLKKHDERLRLSSSQRRIDEDEETETET